MVPLTTSVYACPFVSDTLPSVSDPFVASTVTVSSNCPDTAVDASADQLTTLPQARTSAPTRTTRTILLGIAPDFLKNRSDRQTEATRDRPIHAAHSDRQT